jgi:hypothetical protein
MQDKKESDEHYNFTMTLDQGKATGTLSKDRYDRDHKLIEELKTAKTAERDKVIAERTAI